jgi:LPXTG-motif cell wall-anchored protein
VNTLRRTIAAGALAGGLVLGFAGVAGAQAVDDVEYPPAVSPTTIAQQPQAEVVSANVSAAAVSSSGTLPYTGNDSSLPLAEIGAGLLAAGGLTVVMVRRHQAQAEA